MSDLINTNRSKKFQGSLNVFFTFNWFPYFVYHRQAWLITHTRTSTGWLLSRSGFEWIVSSVDSRTTTWPTPCTQNSLAEDSRAVGPHVITIRNSSGHWMTPHTMILILDRKESFLIFDFKIQNTQTPPIFQKLFVKLFVGSFRIRLQILRVLFIVVYAIVVIFSMIPVVLFWLLTVKIVVGRLVMIVTLSMKIIACVTPKLARLRNFKSHWRFVTIPCIVKFYFSLWFSIH